MPLGIWLSESPLVAGGMGLRFMRSVRSRIALSVKARHLVALRTSLMFIRWTLMFMFIR